MTSGHSLAALSRALLQALADEAPGAHGKLSERSSRLERQEKCHERLPKFQHAFGICLFA